MELATLVLRGGESKVNKTSPNTQSKVFYPYFEQSGQLLAEGVRAFKIEEFYNW
jgi:hypothetical protein